jgi:hypothetical protein
MNRVWREFFPVDPPSPHYLRPSAQQWQRRSKAALRRHELENSITNPTLFRALMLLFPSVAERVADRHPNDFSVANFDEIVEPFLQD